MLDNTENVTTVAHEVEGMFSDINVTARALFSISSAVQFQTQAGVRNVTVLFLIPIDTEPDIEMGDNITLSLTGILYGNTLTTSPTARVIPTESNIVASAEVSKLGDNYTAAFIFPWKSRNEMVSFGSKLPPSVKNASFNYSASSFVGVKGLSLQSNETLNKIINLSYVQEVNGDLVYVNESMNNTDEIERDIKSIVGSNTTVDYPISVMTVSFLSSNFSNSDLTAPSEGEVLVYRGTTIEVRGNVTIGGINYTIPSSSGTFNVMLLDNYTIGQNISVNIAVGTIGRRITSFNLNNA